ncbi:uncharacterized protein LOC127877285 [Dreissena polymorpha]|uniref:Uncharacterized protein n=1 Tax=Dreissena polymorpha TaxID=45954 RepID=A0A9D4QUI3_DREPO|nr:uncharacterized protein LOC127877285 [Dreissena polymorpha]XP_052278933.1 uncharacterized protein LOC127877285 [Dreissena polymorpha]XP_052278934.1 uncharacterized protein LOC127877285 [Dreissena polymorpha]XP_052278935.1 uncharacterized protein LOC127877285 [Dreissena polymorpha]KAH3843989.1 hypothetical protein DPMN_117529 [Dreissena polymorpha]
MRCFHRFHHQRWRSPGTVADCTGKVQFNSEDGLQQSACDSRHTHSAGRYKPGYLDSLGLALQMVPLVAPESPPAPMKRPVALEMGTTDPHKFPIQSSTKGELTRVRRRILPPEVCKPEVPVPIAPAPTVQFVTAPAPDLAPTSSISAPAEPHLPYSTKHYRKRKLEAEHAGEFRRQYNKKLSYRSCNKCFEDRNTGGHKQYY